jgi:S1-C subfamily serine protease
VLPQPALRVVRAGGESIPLPNVAATGIDERRAIALSTLLDSVPRPASNRPPAHAPATSGAHAAQPSVRREGNAVHIDLHGAEASNDVLAGAELAPRDPASGGGYVVRSLDHAGLLAAAGIVVGDAIVAVNGMPTRTPDEAIAAFALARSSPAATLRLERAGRTFEVVADLVR